MKKRFSVFILLVVIVLTGFYFFMPSPATVTKQTWIPAHKSLVHRALTSSRLVQRWWADSLTTVDTIAGGNLQLLRNKTAFTIRPNAFDVVRVDMKQGATSIQSFITILPAQHDSSAVTWKAEMPESHGIGSRVRNYFLAQKIAATMDHVLERLQEFAKNDNAVYGFAISEETVTDTLLVVTKSRSTLMPGVSDYYGLIKKLRGYVAAQGAQETNYPMLHIFNHAPAEYETMVAIPVNKKVAGNAVFLVKRMVPGKILVTEVRGGATAVEEGFRQLDLYMIEHDLRQPGLPFQSLVTDRLVEPDSSKWITKLYYPVM